MYSFLFEALSSPFATIVRPWAAAIFRDCHKRMSERPHMQAVAVSLGNFARCCTSAIRKRQRFEADFAEKTKRV